MSENFIKVIRELDGLDCIQLIPVDVFQKQGKWNEQYFVLHVVNKLDCIDTEKSEYEIRRGFYCDICPLILKEDSVKDTDYIFVLDKAIYGSIFVNEAAQRLLKKSKLRKVEFIEIDERNKSVMNPDTRKHS